MSGTVTLVSVLEPYHRHLIPRAAGSLTQHIRMRLCNQPRSRLRIPLHIRRAEVLFTVPRLQGRWEKKLSRHSVNAASGMSNAGCYAHQSASFPSRFCHNSRRQPSSQPRKQPRLDVLSVFIESKYTSAFQFL